MRIIRKVNERVWQMKYVLSLIIIFLYFLVVNVAAAPSLKVDGEVLDKIDTTGGSSSRSFGMKNRRGDSAWCTIKYTTKVPSSKTLIEAELDKGETKRRDIFEKDTVFEKIVDMTRLGDSFTEYNKVKMDDCRLCAKKTVESEAVADSGEEDSSASFVPDNRIKDNRFPIAPRDMLLLFSLLVNVVVIFTLIIRSIFRERKRQKSIGRYFRADQDVVTWNDARVEKLENKIKIQDEIIAELKTEKQQLITENEYLRGSSAPISKDGNATVHLVAQAQTIVMTQPPPPVVIFKFYFSNPTGSSFNASKSTGDFVDGKSLYCFERVEGESSAEVSVVNEHSVVQRFTYSPEVQMGVCEVVGSYNKNATSIETLEKGNAVLDNDKWTVKKKIKIRYS